MGCVSSSEVKSNDVNNSDDESPIIKTVEVSDSPLTDLDIKQSVSVSLTSPTPDIDSESINLGKITTNICSYFLLYSILLIYIYQNISPYYSYD